MDDLTIDATASTPAVNCRWNEGVVELRGESYPENPFQFFAPIFDWIAALLDEGSAPVTMNLSVSYLNTSSIRSLIDMMEMLQTAHDSGRDVAANWYYDEENDRALEMAEEFKEDFSFAFNLIPVKIGG